MRHSPTCHYFCNKAVYFLLISLFLFGGLTHAQLTVNSVTATPTSCPNNGSITVLATTTSPPLLYSIIGGPVTQPVQTNPVFNSLPAGTYFVRTSDGANNQTISTIVIPGNYQNPTFTISPTSPHCIGQSNGELTGNINPATGTAPYTWQLFTTMPIAIPAPNNSTFSSLPTGNYTMRVTDACGSFTSVAITLQNPSTGFSFLGQQVGEQGSMNIVKIGCDSMRLQYWLHFTNPRFPLSFKYNTSNGVHMPSPGTTTVDTTNLHISGEVMITQIIPGMDYGDYVQAVIHNSCGDSAVSTGYNTHPFIFYPRYAFNECGSSAIVTMANTPYQDYHTSIKTPATYTFTNVTTNTVLHTGTVTAIQNNGMINMPNTLNTGDIYSFSITDGCGETFSSNFVVPGLAPPVIINESILSGSCIDSVVGCYRILTAGFQNTAKLIVLSGPSTLGSTKPLFAYSDTYLYPDTAYLVNYESFLINNLAAGTYHYKIIDDCGNELLGSITINASQVSSLKAEHEMVKGCPGKNKIYYKMVNGGKVTIRNIQTNAILSEREFISWTHDYMAVANNKDSLINLPDGSYEITYDFSMHLGALYSGVPLNEVYTSCWTIVDTIQIPPYLLPEMTTGNAILCNNTINFVLYPDTTTGLQPYTYEIIGGPQTFLEQSSNIFAINTPGTYTARIYDACGNATIKQITADTLSFAPIQVQSSCTNTSMVFPSSIYDTYYWLMPNGQTHIGDSLIINPITPADTGIYQISKVVNINGCVDTVYTTYHVTLNPYSSQTIEFCAGSSVVIGGSTYYLPGTYNDTLVTLQGCDSVVTSHLVLIEQQSDTTIVSICYGDSLQIAGQYYNTPGFYTDSVQNIQGCYDLVITDLRINQLIDTVDASICSGQIYTFGGVDYTQAGYYPDTLITVNGCDSISVLHLNTTPFLQYSFNDTICAGSSYFFAGNLLNVPGVYTDTLSTLSCDSVVTLALTVLPYPHDSVVVSICPNQTYTFGGIALTQPGIYTDTLSVNGCDTIVTLTLQSTPYLQDSIEASICSGQTYLFGGNSISAAGVYSDTLSTNTCDSIVTLTLSVLPYIQQALTVDLCAGEQYNFAGTLLSSAGVYTDTLSTQSCDSIVELTLNILPYKTFVHTVTICQGESFASGGNTYSIAGTYSDTLSTTSCDSIVNLTLIVLPAKQSTIHASICANEKYTFGNVDYVNAGTYTRTFPTNTCDSTITLILTVAQIPSVDIVTTLTDSHNGTLVQLNATTNINPAIYFWTSGASLSNYNIANPSAIIQGPTWFHVTVSNGGACSATDSILVQPLVTSTLYIPNTFTPNGDRHNETFRVYGTNIDEFQIMIFDRWGELIFESNNLDTGWDATYMGDAVQNDMYVYKVIAKGYDYKKYNWIGHIFVLR